MPPTHTPPRPASADLVARADALFDEVSPYEGDGLRNHCLRLRDLTDLLLRRDRLPMDRPLLHMVAMVHDLGIVRPEETGKNYMQRSAALFERTARELGLEAGQRQLARQCLLYNHRVRPVPGVPPQAERMRRAVWIEHTLGLRTFGLPRAEVREVLRRHPRLDFDHVLADFTRRVLLHEPTTLVRGIFF